MVTGGTNLRRVSGLTIPEVENASARIVERQGNDEFLVSPSRFSDIESKGVVPSVTACIRSR
jgi:hypothetical protein